MKHPISTKTLTIGTQGYAQNNKGRHIFCVCKNVHKLVVYCQDGCCTGRGVESPKLGKAGLPPPRSLCCSIYNSSLKIQ